MEYPWGHSRRFNSYSEFMKRKFGSRVQKLALDAGFTCPNRDGTKGTGGCTFCNNNAFNPSYCDPAKGITWQLDEGIKFHKNRYRKSEKYLAYFQAYTNTYRVLYELKSLYDEALAHPDVIGLVIGTRPDTMSDELLDHFQLLAQQYYIVIEYGIESCYNETLERINRGHTNEDSLIAIDKTASRGLEQGVHFIIGLPGESEDDILNEMKIVSGWPVSKIKFHQLQIVKNTAMGKEYSKNPKDFRLFSMEEYLDLMVRITEQLNPGFVIERVAGEVNPGFQVGPSWGLRYDQILRKFEEMLEGQDTWQGRNFGDQ